MFCLAVSSSLGSRPWGGLQNLFAALAEWGRVLICFCLKVTHSSNIDLRIGQYSQVTRTSALRAVGGEGNCPSWNTVLLCAHGSLCTCKREETLILALAFYNDY